MIRKIILRELKSSPKFILFFVLNLAIGLMGLASIEFLKFGMLGQVASQAKSILGADVSISSRIKIAQEKVDLVSHVFVVEDMSQSISLFSMGQFKNQTKLINIKTIENKFPFYGEFKTQNGEKLSNIKDNEVFLYKELKIQLGVEIGDEIRIGESTFKIVDFITQDPNANLQFGSLAPRGFISRAGLEKSKLIQKGSTAFYEYFFKVKNKSTKFQELKSILTKKIDNNAIRVNIPATTSDQVSRVMAYLNDFLGLVSLSGLFLSSLGLIYLFKSYIHSRRREFAILKFLGVSRNNIFLIYFGELFILGFLGSVIGTTLGMLLYPIIVNILSGITGQDIQLAIELKSILVILGIGTIATLVLAPLLIIPYLYIDYKILFSHSDELDRRISDYLLFIPLIGFYWGTSIYLSNSYIIGTSFVALFAILSGLAFPISKILLKKLSQIKVSLSLNKKLALTYITRHSTSTVFVFGTIFLCTFLMTLMPIVKTSINKELDTPSSLNGPSLFLFDIQEEQIGALKEIGDRYQLNILNESPMVRARLISINDKNLETDMSGNLTREEESEVRSRNRGVNLTYRSKLDEGETLIAGRLPVHNDSLDTEIYEISLEVRYAGRIGAKLGDILLFDVLDLPVKAKVVGLRQVRWTSFLPNFFINFGTGVLEDAPKTYLSAFSNPKAQNLDLFQNDVAKELSNISIVDVVRVVARVKATIDNMSKILSIMSYSILLVGLLVIFCLVSHQINLRSIDISLYKLLGLNRKNILEILNFEITLISISAIISGVFLSIIFGWILSVYIFQSSFGINVTELFSICATIFIAVRIINHWAVSKITQRKINDVFSEIN